jgi:hypothetical protein
MRGTISPVSRGGILETPSHGTSVRELRARFSVENVFEKINSLIARSSE